MNKYIKKINRSFKKQSVKKLSTIGLFSGIFGIEIGLEREGFKTKLAIDFDKDCRDVVKDNKKFFRDIPYICDDIYNISPEYALKMSGLRQGQVTLLAGGPPCQPFSKSGLRKGIKDKRGILFKRYLDFLTIIKPKVFLLENVKGLVSSRNGEDFKEIIKCFDQTGYLIYWKVIDAANYGVPQFRQRLFIIGFKERIKYSFPDFTHISPRKIEEMLFPDYEPFVSVKEAISNIPNKVKGPKLNGKYSHLLKDIPPGLNYSYYTKERNHPNPIFEWRSKFWYFLLKSNPNKPSLTIQANPGNNTGPFHWENRRFSIEELKRIQSFPDWFEINESYMIAHRLLGNAVPPLLAETLGNSINKALENGEQISKHEYLRIRNYNDIKVL